jgi:hypothetical protein
MLKEKSNLQKRRFSGSQFNGSRLEIYNIFVPAYSESQWNSVNPEP